MKRDDRNKNALIRRMLLETVGKNPDLFCYFTSIQEAKSLIVEGEKKNNSPFDKNCINLTKIVDC